MINPDRNLHFNFANEQYHLESLSSTEAYKFTASQTLHYLLEHVLKVDNPWLFSHDGLNYSYSLRETVGANGQKSLIPEGYDQRTDFAEVCSAPWRTLSVRLAGKSPTKQELRLLKRYHAEAEGAQKLQEMILAAPDNTIFIWCSPPGLKEDGYWDSSLTYFFEVKRISETQRRILGYRCITRLSCAEQAAFINRHDLTTPEDLVVNPVYSTAGENITELVAKLLTLDGRPISPAEIRRQLTKIEVLAQTLKPEFAQLAELARAGNLKAADKKLDEIEQIAMAQYFSPEELKTLSGFNYLTIESYNHSTILSTILEAAWLTRREQMRQIGTSCPSVSRSDNPLEPIDPHQILLKKLGFNGNEPQKCPDCAQAKDLSQPCCQKCQFK